MAYIFIHGSGQKASSWNETISYMKSDESMLCPNMYSILDGKEANYTNLYSSFVEYCNKHDEPLNLCGLSLGGILALNFASDFPGKVKTLVLIGTPHKIPRIIFSIQNIIFRFLPESVFGNMEFSKKDIFILGNSMKKLDFSDSLNRVTCPTLIICGKKDGMNKKSAYYLAENIENAELRIIDNTGHILNEEKPEVLAQELKDFYDENK